MANNPSPQVTAHQILKVFVDPPYYCHPGDSVDERKFLTTWYDRRQWHNFKRGVKYAVGHGWLTLVERRVFNAYKLTRTGFKEAK